MPLPFPRPWKIIDTGSAFKITDANGRALAFVYYRRDGTLPEYMTVEEARSMAKAIARLSLGTMPDRE
jgi:hypothetical protein